MTRPTKIYFDESGYTGNNLLHPLQPIFSYASVKVDEEEAKELVSSIISRYRVQNGELKGARLLKYNRGRQAICDILRHFDGRMKVSVNDKKYALAGKFFEYIFEPPLQSNSGLFYELNFHRFVSNILYLEFMFRGAGAEEIFSDFEKLMRSGSFDGLDALFSTSRHHAISPVLSQIRDFAIINRDAIIRELDGYAGVGAGKWVLDLTNTALFSLLAQWGTEVDCMTAICDFSKPLASDQGLFNVMIGRTEKIFSSLGGQDSPITFNLSGPIQLVDSKTTPGVQLADCIAAAFAYACDSRVNDRYSIEWRSYIDGSVIFGSAFPDLDHVDLSRIEVQRNAILLQELHDRSTRGADLLNGMPQFAQFLTEQLHLTPI